MQLRAEKLPIVELNGSSFEQGLQHGKAAPDLIAANLRLLIPRDKRVWSGRDFHSVETILEKSDRFLSTHFPELKAEIQGIATGAQLPYEELLQLNILAVDWLGRFAAAECSQIVACSGDVFGLAKTRDMSVPYQHVVLSRQYPDNRALVEITAAGSILWPGSGVNAEGLLLATSGVWSKRTAIEYDASDRAFILLDSHSILRECRGVNDVVDMLKRVPRLTGMNITVVGTDGAAAIEATADEVYVEMLRPDRGFLVRTNHYATGTRQDLSPTREEYPSSYLRYDAITSMLGDYSAHSRAYHLLDALSLHGEDENASVCRHFTTQSDIETVYTSIALRSASSSTFVALGGTPCEHHLAFDEKGLQAL